MNYVKEISQRKQERYELEAKSKGCKIVDMALHHQRERNDTIGIIIFMFIMYIVFFMVGILFTLGMLLQLSGLVV